MHTRAQVAKIEFPDPNHGTSCVVSARGPLNTGNLLNIIDLFNFDVEASHYCEGCWVSSGANRVWTSAALLFRLKGERGTG